MTRLSTHGSMAAAPMGGDRHANLKEYTFVLLDYVARTPDLTLAELKAAYPDVESGPRSVGSRAYSRVTV